MIAGLYVESCWYTQGQIQVEAREGVELYSGSQGRVVEQMLLLFKDVASESYGHPAFRKVGLWTDRN